MARLIELSTHIDGRGCLGVVDEGELPFEVKRIFLIHSVPDDATRGGHAHLKTKLLLFCLTGSCRIVVGDEDSSETFELEGPSRCLFIDVGEWHLLSDFRTDSTLLALASEPYDPEDYIKCGPR